jgi:carnitine O-acetyltransferase
MTEREVLQNLKAIVADADKTPLDQISATAIGMLTTENRKVWSKLRKGLQNDRMGLACLNVIDQALFVVCLDDAAPESLADVCNNFLCGSYNLTPSEACSLLTRL